ncbi:MAG TPA: NYN domain-containing protein [Candidatus Bathyarchaeia archaeon]|nr:NYN domain-containing protein [Candidatus Bathyarchaeia archaeon]
MGLITGGSPRPTERVMIFIDGGYLRKTYRELFGDDKIDYLALPRGLLNLYEATPFNIFRADLIRAYYYDAIVSEKEPERDEQQKYFNSVSGNFSITVRLGELVKSSKGEPRQKGVDILMAIDTLSKAYMNHYDVAMFLLGDRDFIPLIEAVKNSGKKTFGFYYGIEDEKGQIDSKVPDELSRTFDFRVALLEETLKKWRKT